MAILPMTGHGQDARGTRGAFVGPNSVRPHKPEAGAPGLCGRAILAMRWSFYILYASSVRAQPPDCHRVAEERFAETAR